MSILQSKYTADRCQGIQLVDYSRIKEISLDTQGSFLDKIIYTGYDGRETIKEVAKAKSIEILTEELKKWEKEK